MSLDEEQQGEERIMKWPHIFAIVIFVMLIPVVAVVLKNEEKQKKVNAQKAAMAAAQAQLEREAVTREKFDKIRQGHDDYPSVRHYGV